MIVSGYKIGPGANLAWADLRGAYLTGANLAWADLRGANLRGANLRGAYLSRADLAGAYLTGADLSRAKLTGADLTGANLSGEDLTGANLSGTVLDPANTPNQRGAELFFRLRSGRLIGYRTRRSTHVGSAEYVPGRRYRAPWFSTCTTECHPGLYLWPTVEMARKWMPGAELVAVSFRLEDLHQAGDKWRVREFLVLKREVK